MTLFYTFPFRYLIAIFNNDEHLFIFLVVNFFILCVFVLFLFIIIFGHAGSFCGTGLLLVGVVGASPAGAQASYCDGFFLQSTGSRPRGFSSCGTQA